MDPTRTKPRLRGVSHEIACYVSAAAGCYLVAQVREPAASSAFSSWAALAAVTVYSLCLFFQFAASTLYHRPNWTDPATRQLMRRLDHAAISLLIAGTATPVAVMGLPPERRALALALIWSGAILGLLKSLFWIGAPKPVSAAIFVLFGGALAAYLPGVTGAIGGPNTRLLVVGGLLYVAGAVVYALKKPDPAPAVFGYHEIFHALVIAAAATQYCAIYRIVIDAAHSPG